MDINIKKTIVGFLISFFLCHNATLLAKTKQKEPPLSQIKKSVVFLGEVNQKGEKRFRATGFLVNVRGIYHLVTTKHVVMQKKDGRYIPRDGGLHVFFNTKDNRVGARSIKDVKSKYSVNWIFHSDPNVDIAIIPFGLNAEKDDVRTIPETLFLGVEKLFELYDIFFLSYQPGVKHQKKICPVTRTGTISLINDDRTFYVDAFAFPGNSGAPVFLKPSLLRPDRPSKFTVDKLGWKFVGIIGDYITYREPAISLQTGRPRVIFEENTGLSRVWSVSFINEIIESEEFNKQLSKLPKKRGH